MSDLFPSLITGLRRALRCFGRGMKKLGRALLYIVPVLLVIHISATLITGHMVNNELRRIRAAGQALTMRELAPRVPPGEKNAADLYQRAFDALRLSKEDEEKLFAPEGLPKEGQRAPGWMALARKVVAANRDYFIPLEQASETPACAFPVKWDDPLAAVFPHFSSMRDAARMLSLRAEVLAADRDLDGAIASCATALRMAEHAKMEPTLIGQLVAYAIQGMQTTALERALSAGTPSDGAARKLHDQLAAIDQMTPFARAMHGERTFGIWGFDVARSAASRKLMGDVFALAQPPWAPQSWQWATVHLYRTVGRPLLNLDELAYLRMWEKHSRAVQLPWPQSGEESKAVDDAVSHLPIYRSILTRTVLPAFAFVVQTREMRTAQLRAAQIALALTAYRAEHRSYPDSLAELEQAGWNLPTDPFGSQPYHYRRSGNGFVIWSIGPDMDDDNAAKDYASFLKLPGLEQQKRQRDYDLIFRCQP